MNYGAFTIAAQEADDRGSRDLAKRLRMEGRMANTLVETLLAKGCTISVSDGEEWTVRRSADRTAIMAALFSTDEDVIAAYDTHGNKLGWFQLTYGNDGYDVIGDSSANEFCDAIWKDTIMPLSNKLEAEG